MKNLIILIGLLGVWVPSVAQNSETLSLETCYESAKKNYPLTKQRELIALTEEYSIANASKGRFPSLTINGQQTYQSDVTKVPVPEMNIPELSKNQYKVYGEVGLNLYDGGTVKNQKEQHRTNAQLEDQKLEVELYKLNERINQLFFGILTIDAQIAQNELLKIDIERGIRKTEASITNGVALKSSADALHAELLKTNQRTIELQAIRIAYGEMLGQFIGKPITSTTQLEKPQALANNFEINRPELLLYQYQREAIDLQNKMIATRNRPKLSSFFQAGYGRPALNMLNTQADSYYITGLRLNWNITGFYTTKKERALLDINRKNIDLQKETFLYNTNLTMKNQQGEVNKLRQVLASDDEIIALREKIKNTASAQLENGVINATDYLREVTAEDQARQSKILHEIQLLLAQYNLKTTSGI
jgi:outer membrane protein TolC